MKNRKPMKKNSDAMANQKQPMNKSKKETPKMVPKKTNKKNQSNGY